jgi:ABC-type hemin transport system substrate-binding protein
VYPFSTQIDHVMHILSDPLAESDLGRVLGQPAKAEALKLQLLQELAQIKRATADMSQPRVLVVIGLDPVMASGLGTVHDELLRYAGAVNAAAHAQVTAPTFDRESLIGMQPEVVLLLRPGDPPLGPNDPRLATFAGLAIPAVRDDRIILLNDPTAMLPSTSLVRLTGQIARAIHPNLQLDELSDE